MVRLLQWRTGKCSISRFRVCTISSNSLRCGLDPAPLLTEAIRGEGAYIVDENNERFLFEDDPLGRWHQEMSYQDLFINIKQKDIQLF